MKFSAYEVDEVIQAVRIDWASARKGISPIVQDLIKGVIPNSYPYFFPPGTTQSEAEEAISREVDVRSTLIVITAIESMFKSDYHYRVNNGLPNDSLTGAFKLISAGLPAPERVSLERDIFDVWKQHLPSQAGLIGKTKVAFALRNWVAHGRSWVPKIGARINYSDALDLVRDICGLPIQGVDLVAIKASLP